MDDSEAPEPDLASRVRELERTIVHLEAKIDAVTRRPPPPPPVLRPTLALPSADPGQWINRLGIALLLFGAAFGFKYSIDRGWIGPAVRVWSGLILSAVLLGLSGPVRSRRAGLSRALAGGGIACGYLSVFAAFHLYALVSHGAAFAAMSVVTCVAFAVSVRDDEAITAVIATIGGLATPFVLDNGGGDIAGLVAYTCIVVAASGAIFAKRGWSALLATSTTGGWLVIAGAATGIDRGGGGGGDAIAVQAGIVFVALATWWLCVMRETWAAGARESNQSGQLTLATPVMVLALSAFVWKLELRESGWISLSLTAAWSLAAVHLRRIPLEVTRSLATTHALGAAVMLAFAMSFLLGNDACRLGLAAEALALLVLASRTKSGRPALLAHVLFAVVAWETLLREVDSAGSRVFAVHAADVTDLAVIAALGAAARLQGTGPRDLYLLAAETGLLGWLWRVLGSAPNGAAIVTASWFTNAVVLVVAGLRRDSAIVRAAGSTVMALTMAKLFVFDLAQVDALWRIVTFLGFGAVLLGLGYAFPILWRRDSPPATARNAEDPRA